MELLLVVKSMATRELIAAGFVTVEDSITCIQPKSLQNTWIEPFYYGEFIGEGLILSKY